MQDWTISIQIGYRDMIFRFASPTPGKDGDKKEEKIKALLQIEKKTLKMTSFLDFRSDEKLMITQTHFFLNSTIQTILLYCTTSANALKMLKQNLSHQNNMGLLTKY